MAAAAQVKAVETKVGNVITSIVVLVVVVIIAVVLYRVYKGAKTAGGAVGDAIGDRLIANANGMTVQRVQVCRQVANDLVNNIGPWYTGYNVDEEAWIAALNRLTTAAEARVTSSFFKEQKSAGLRSWINDSLSSAEKARVHSIVLSNIY